jgi:hypothetical protein
MRRPRYLDLTCPTCRMQHTRFVETNDDNTLLEPEVCGANSENYDGVECDGVLTVNEMHTEAGHGYMKTITKGNHDFNDRERERLEKRSDHHWKHMGGRDEAIERERAMLKKNGMEGTGGVK